MITKGKPVYRILIEKIEPYTYVKREWQRVADTGNERDGGAQYDYAETTATSTQTEKVLEMTRAKISVTGIVRAILATR